MIKLMADPTCDLSQEIVERYNIGVTPLNIEIKGVNYRDKIGLTSDEFFERLPDMEELPKTGAPSPEAYLRIIEEAMAEGYSEFLCICMSSGTSASYQAAEIARESFEELIAFNETHKKRVKHFLCVEDLHNLTKSVRISNAGAFIGSLLRVKPIMSMKDTKGAIVAKARGTKKALNYYVEEFQKRVDPEWTNFVIIGYSNDKSIADQLKEKSS